VTEYTVTVDGNGSTSTPGAHSLEQLLLAGLGWLSLTAEAADDIAEDLAQRVGVEPARMREAVRATFASLRRDAERAGSLPSDASERALKRLGLVRRDEVDDLGLRLAQLEHRVRLLEKPEA
jgi:polyhydroxyalkanoate synthesis regulator phasin